jgi:hypothetical protein
MSTADQLRLAGREHSSRCLRMCRSWGCRLGPVVRPRLTADRRDASDGRPADASARAPGSAGEVRALLLRRRRDSGTAGAEDLHNVWHEASTAGQRCTRHGQFDNWGSSIDRASQSARGRWFDRWREQSQRVRDRDAALLRGAFRDPPDQARRTVRAGGHPSRRSGARPVLRHPDRWPRLRLARPRVRRHRDQSRVRADGQAPDRPRRQPIVAPKRASRASRRTADNRRPARRVTSRQALLDAEFLHAWREQMECAPPPPTFERGSLRALVGREPNVGGDQGRHVALSRPGRLPRWEDLAEVPYEVRPRVPTAPGAPWRSRSVNAHPHTLHPCGLLDEHLIAERRRNAHGHRSA